uniref:Metallopeptidase n=1 Tax=Fasciola hepatica TaxID=6192 RepID=A0AA94YHU9_FASHE|nr:metallopeptidase [Fasciola hepatica]
MMSTDCSDWKTWAEQLVKEISAEFMMSTLEEIAGEGAHPVGSDANYSLVEWLAATWKSWGIPLVKEQEFFVTLPMAPADGELPNEVVLIDLKTGLETSKESKSSQCGQVAHANSLLRSRNSSQRLPTAYQAYSESGTAIGPYVFVNYASPQDLIEFDRAQGRTEGTPSLLCDSRLIAVARLSQGTRQSKVRSLHSHCKCGPQGTSIPGHHPAALVLYPDPVDVIPPSQPVYPKGLGLPGDAPVFGHVCMASVGGGNPGTPLLPSSEHIYEEDALVPGLALTSILVQPIGYDQAREILSHLSGPNIPQTWKGCLAARCGPSTDYHLRVTVRNTISAQPVRCVNLLGVIPADGVTSDESDQYVVLGNHHDTWCQGACDPGSGTVLLQQVAKILGGAYAKGFRPRRTVVLASWDGEELSLLGSTHFAEAFRVELTRRAVAYVNADCPIKGHEEFNARTDPLLADALILASRLVLVDPPADKLSLYDQWLAQEKPDSREPEVSLPGGGSDHIPFAYKLGIPSSYPEYVPDYSMYTMPMYHTWYDNVDVVERFLDPPSPQTGPLPRHRLMARLWLTFVLYLACAPRLPYSPVRLARRLREQWEQLVQKAHTERSDWNSQGIHFEWITEELLKFDSSVANFELLARQWETSYDRFPTQLNRILAGLPEQFVTNHLDAKTPFCNVLLGVSGYGTVTFPQVRSAVRRFCASPNSANLTALKRALSILTACIQRATSWLGNGLLGFDNLQPVSEVDGFCVI